MKYMLLIYSDENAWTESEWQHCYTESMRLTHQLHAQGQYLGARHYNLFRRQPVFGFVTENGW